jgi:dTDP-4-dehydrorhamnose reductase
MKILLTGHLGQLATDFKARLQDEELILTEFEDLDLSIAGRVSEFVSAVRPDLILNCAAYNRVDEAEDRPEAAFAANAYAPRNLALAARECGATLVHFSTDYVFDGPGRVPYVETDRPCPQSVYGISKLSGELMVQATWNKHFIFRVCGLYGYAGSRDKGTNFVETMLALGAQGKPLKVVDDQILTPTSTKDVVEAVLPVIGTDRYGLYHLTAAGQCSWYEFACAIFAEAGLDVPITPVKSEFYKTKARRPRYSVLDNRSLREAGFQDLPPWRDGLHRYIQGRPARQPG